MAIYPFPENIQAEVKNMPKGNFGLWYNKYVPLSEKFKSANDKGLDTEAVEYYFNCYNQMKNATPDLLKIKHKEQADYCASFPLDGYEVITIRATLKSPLITGIGESHPHEVSMVFDHNLGIPYIPASGVKGIVRFSHTLSLIDEAKKRDSEVEKSGKFDDEEKWTLIPLMFGKQDRRGRVVFLDAYPENVPDLHIDIMNPHYVPYYSEGQSPADYHNPTPIKFLTVAKDTVFIFRAVVQKIDDIPQKVNEALKKALTEEGVGAKTAVGYGRFDIGAEKTALNMSSETVVNANDRGVNKVAPLEEVVWENVYVSFNAGGGSVVTATSKDGKKAEIRGKGKALTAVAESLHKRLFEKPRNIPKASVTVQKAGNLYEIVRVEEMTIRE